MSHKVTLIPGDGIGPEITEVARKCVEATGVSVQWEYAEAGASALEKYGTVLPADTLDAIRSSGVAWKGPITTPIGKGFRSVNVALRQSLDLYMCLRPYKLYPGVRSRFTDVDLVVVRENTEDLYAGIEFEANSSATHELLECLNRLTDRPIRLDSGISIKPISLSASSKITRAAFDYAIANNREKVTAVHKANIMKYTDGLFMAAAREVATLYGDRILFEDKLVDNMCMQLVQKPELYDVLVLPNLYGDIISDLCAGLVGGLGMAPGANIGDECAVFEPTHGSAPKYAGQNKVNPIGMVLSGVMMLQYIGETEAANRLERAVADVISRGQHVTFDLKSRRDDSSAVGTRQMGQAIVDRLSGVSV